MVQYIIRDSESGNIITQVDSFEEALLLVESYEHSDKKENIYTSNFYEIIINGVFEG